MSGIEPTDANTGGKHFAKVAFLIGARLVVPVHPGPPFLSGLLVVSRKISTRNFTATPG